jgi:hypothetical protein
MHKLQLKCCCFFQINRKISYNIYKRTWYNASRVSDIIHGKASHIILELNKREIISK